MPRKTGYEVVPFERLERCLTPHDPKLCRGFFLVLRRRKLARDITYGPYDTAEAAERAKLILTGKIKPNRPPAPPRSNAPKREERADTQVRYTNMRDAL